MLTRTRPLQFVPLFDSTPELSHEAADLMAPGARFDPREMTNAFQAWETEGPDLKQSETLQAAMTAGDFAAIGRIVMQVSEEYWAEIAEREVDEVVFAERGAA